MSKSTKYVSPVGCQADHIGVEAAKQEQRQDGVGNVVPCGAEQASDVLELLQVGDAAAGDGRLGLSYEGDRLRAVAPSRNGARVVMTGMTPSRSIVTGHQKTRGRNGARVVMTGMTPSRSIVTGHQKTRGRNGARSW